MWPLNHTPQKINMEPENTGPLEKENHLPSPIIFRFDVNLPGVKKNIKNGARSRNSFFFPQHLLEKTCSSRDRLLDHLKAKQRSDRSPWQPRKRRTEDLGWLVDWCLLVTLLFFFMMGECWLYLLDINAMILQHWHLFDKWFDQWDSQALIGKVLRWLLLVTNRYNSLGVVEWNNF